MHLTKELALVHAIYISTLSVYKESLNQIHNTQLTMERCGVFTQKHPFIRVSEMGGLVEIDTSIISRVNRMLKMSTLLQALDILQVSSVEDS